jgi:type IV pilus assembly protein PilO
LAITFEDIMKLSTPKKLGILGIIILLIVLVLGQYLLLPAYEKLDAKDREYTKLEQDLNEKKRVAQDPKIFEAKLESVKRDLEIKKAQLPDKKEIPQLLTTISSLGKESGLNFLLFRPKPEVPKEFFAEIPVEIKVEGGYHEVASFFSRVGNLDRIVNITNVIMEKPKDQGGKMILTTSCLATTFMFMETPVAKEEPSKIKTKRKK